MRVRRLIGAIVGMVLMLVALVPGTAHAEDDYLIGSDPQPRQELNETPGWVTLAFRTKASAQLAKILVLDAGGANVTAGALIVEGTNVTTQLRFELPKGTYSVYYRTSNADGQPRGGAFQFAYGKGEWTPLDKEVWVGEAEQPPILANPDPNEPGPASPSAGPSVDPSASATTAGTPPSGTAAPTADPSMPGQSGAQGSGAALWWAGAIVVAAGLLGWAATVFVRRRRTGGGEG